MQKTKIMRTNTELLSVLLLMPLWYGFLTVWTFSLNPSSPLEHLDTQNPLFYTGSAAPATFGRPSFSSPTMQHWLATLKPSLSHQLERHNYHSNRIRNLSFLFSCGDGPLFPSLPPSSSSLSQPHHASPATTSPSLYPSPQQRLSTALL